MIGFIVRSLLLYNESITILVWMFTRGYADDPILLLYILYKNQEARSIPATTEMSEASAPKAPPVRSSPPEMQGVIILCPKELPETAKPKILPCV